MAGSIEEGTGVVADPVVLDVYPPVALILLDFDADFFLRAAGDAIRGECCAWEDCAVYLDPALDVTVIAAEIVALLLVPVVGKVGEEMRIEVSADFLVDLPTDFDGLVVAEGGVKTADLEEREVGRGLDVRGVAGYNALTAIVHDSLF